MPKSVLSNFVNGTRALLVAQIIACTGAIALAGWTLGVTNQVLREISGMRFGGAFGAMSASLSSGLGETGKAALALAMSFFTWRTLVRETGLPPDTAVEIMAGLVRNAGA